MKIFLDNYSRYKASELDFKKVKQSHILPLLENLPPLFVVEKIGKSFENRDIYGVRVGQGAKRVLAWSQMHGDESTATRSLFDLFHFLAADDEFNSARSAMLGNLSMLFVPMLNPDGAERWQRENAQNIDINRDARKRTTPEAQILQQLHRNFQPHFALNLHDQNKYYSAGNSKNPATFSFLAAPPDHNDTLSTTRQDAIKLIVCAHKALQQVLPHRAARWNDDYEPRAFGEWFQAQQVATVLVEAGGYPNDEEGCRVRHFHFGILLTMLQSIAANAYSSEPIEPYYAIPLNRENGLFDRIERQAAITIDGRTFTTDVGYRENETVTGDLSDYGSYEEMMSND
ncbi:MAG: hypothetical protein FWH23_00665 [Bacteroidales bacterium]|nr:hypothetical protein [Bacteroidales bacterium]MCL2133434.1 hypothetical protein [Bacteroidales bacterium]